MRPDLCEAIVDADKKTECHDRAVMASISESGDISICESIHDDTLKTACRDRTANNYAIAQGNKGLCVRITDPLLKKKCREDIDTVKLRTLVQEKTATEETCTALEESFQKECLRSIDTHRGEEQYLTAIKSGNLAMCDAITDSRLSTVCRDTILLDRAQKDANGSLCAQITDAEKKAYCTSRISTSADITQFQDATKSNNLQACMSIADVNLRNRCHDVVILELVRNSKNVQLCSTLTNTGIIESCQRIQTP